MHMVIQRKVLLAQLLEETSCYLSVEGRSNTHFKYHCTEYTKKQNWRCCRWLHLVVCSRCVWCGLDAERIVTNDIATFVWSRGIKMCITNILAQACRTGGIVWFQRNPPQCILQYIKTRASHVHLAHSTGGDKSSQYHRSATAHQKYTAD